MCSAVLEGIWPGQVWVDDPEQPATALLVTFLSGGGAAWCFLAGNPHNHGVNTTVNKILFEEKKLGAEVGAFLFTCAPEDWGGRLEIVGNPRQPAQMPRQHYICRELAWDWKPHLPDGFQVIPLKVDLLKDKSFQIPEQVKTTLGKWMSIKDESFRDFGFAAIYEYQVVAWATVDFVTAKSGDLGFETLPEFQKRGLGSVVAARALEYGLKMGLEIHWTCAADNGASQRTAQKLGLSRQGDYTMYFFALDEYDHLAQLAYSKLAQGQHRDAIDLYESLFSQKADVPVWAYFDAAQAWAALGESRNALKYLRQAAKSGWTAVEMVEQTQEFSFMQDTPAWKDVIRRMRLNQERAHERSSL